MRVNELTDSEAAFHIGQWHAAFTAFGALGFAKLGQVLQVGEAFLESHEFFVRQNTNCFLPSRFRITVFSVVLVVVLLK